MHQVQTQQSQLGDVPRQKRLTHRLQEDASSLTPCSQWWTQTSLLGCKVESFYGNSQSSDEIIDNRDTAQDEHNKAESSGQTVSSVEDGGAKKFDEPFKGGEFFL